MAGPRYKSEFIFSDKWFQILFRTSCAFSCRFRTTPETNKNRSTNQDDPKLNTGVL